MSNEITELPAPDSALTIYSQPMGLDPWLEKIRAEVSGHVPDVKTKKGRDHIASLAFKVRKSKTALDGLGKKLVDDLKDVPKRIDAERKRVRETLDALADQVRKPLTDWEDAEEARIEAHKDRILCMQEYTQEASTYQVDFLRDRIQYLTAMQVDQSWEEFEAEAHRVKASTLAALNSALTKALAYEAEQAELARLRAEAAAREQQEREECIAREAAERARREEEAKAQAEREAVIRREQEAKAAAERRELELRLQAEQAERAAAKAEADRIAAEQRAERERVQAIDEAERQKVIANEREAKAKEDAEKAAAQALVDAKAREEAAAQRERDRIATEKAAADAETKRREADKKHRASVNRAAMEAFVAGGMTEDAAKMAVTLIAKGAIPAVKVSY